MYANGVTSEGILNYNLLFCHACLSSSRALTTVGDYIDIYLKICENSRLNVTSQINLCWECLTLLKKVRAFKKKVENAQKILDYCGNKQAPLGDSLSHLTLSNIEISNFVPILQEDENEYEDEDELNKSDAKLQPEDLCDPKDELMFKIEDVRGCCEIVDLKPALDLSASSDCDGTVKVDSLTPEASEDEQRYRRWKRSAMLVYQRICGHQYARHFLQPVSDELAPLYSRIVRRPTDLTTIKRRVRDGLIRTTKDLRHALLLMFSNALMYNSSEHDIYLMTMELRDETIRELELLSAAQAHAASPRAPPPPPRRRPASPPPPPARPVSPPTLPASPPARPASPPAPPRRRRWDWTDWREQGDLLAIKKYKSAVLL